MKRVLHLTHTSVPNDARILKELKALSHDPALDVYAFGVREQADIDARGFALRQFRVRSARATWLPRALRYALVLIEVNARFAPGIMRLRPDLIHCHDTMVLPSGAVAKLLWRSTLVYDAHELESDKAGQSRALSSATFWIEKACWPLVDALITVSRSIEKWYRANLGAKRTLCLLNAPEVPEGPSEITSGTGLKEKLGVPPDIPLFVYVGALEPGRGIELLLDVFSVISRGSHVAFVGDGSLRGSIRRVAEEHDNVHHHEPVPHDQLVAFIRDADGAFCLIERVSLSDYYSLPNKLFECAFAGLPVIASRLPEIEAVVSRYNLGTCVDLDRESVSAAIESSIGRGRVDPAKELSALSWETQAEALRSLYLALLASSPGRTRPHL